MTPAPRDYFMATCWYLFIAFIIVESDVATVLQGRVLIGLPSNVMRSTIAGLAAAAVALPFTRFVKIVPGRLIPDLAEDDVQVRKLDLRPQPRGRPRRRRPRSPREPDPCRPPGKSRHLDG